MRASGSSRTIVMFLSRMMHMVVELRLHLSLLHSSGACCVCSAAASQQQQHKLSSVYAGNVQ